VRRMCASLRKKSGKRQCLFPSYTREIKKWKGEIFLKVFHTKIMIYEDSTVQTQI